MFTLLYITISSYFLSTKKLFGYKISTDIVLMNLLATIAIYTFIIIARFYGITAYTVFIFISSVIMILPIIFFIYINVKLYQCPIPEQD